MAIHILLFVITLLATAGNVEGQAFLVYIFDFPLVLLLNTFPSGGYILYNSWLAYIVVFSIGGTLMYGLLGCVVGFLAEQFMAFIDSRSTEERH